MAKTVYHLPMRCPICNLPLIVVERDSIEVDYCIECHGLWFDEGEIEILGEKAGMKIDLSTLENATPSVSNERYLRCPRCAKKMKKTDLHRDGDLMAVDSCPQLHGIWFDQGEVGRLVRSADRTENAAAEAITRFLGETFEPAKH